MPLMAALCREIVTTLLARRRTSLCYAGPRPPPSSLQRVHRPCFHRPPPLTLSHWVAERARACPSTQIYQEERELEIRTLKRLAAAPEAGDLGDLEKPPPPPPPAHIRIPFPAAGEGSDVYALRSTEVVWGAVKDMWAHALPAHTHR